MIRSLLALAGLVALVAGVPCMGASAGYPSKAVRIIVPFPPGATTDVLGRLLALKLTDLWSQPVVVENRGGAGGTIGAAYAAKAAPDGYTLFIGSVGSLGTSSGLYPNLPYDPVKDFAPITLAVRAPSVLVVHPSIAANSTREFIEYLKANGAATSYGSSGNGSPSHLAAELFKSMAGVQAVHVPYRGVEGFNDLAAGRLQFFIGSVTSSMPVIKLGKVKPLATTGSRRLAELPALPTVAESGIPGYEVYVWYGLLAPAGAPGEIVAQLNKQLIETLNLREVKSSIAAQGGEVATSTPEEFAQFIRNEVTRWNRVIKLSGAKID